MDLEVPLDGSEVHCEVLSISIGSTIDLARIEKVFDLWDGVNFVTPLNVMRVNVLVNGSSIYFGLLASEDKKTQEGIFWVEEVFIMGNDVYVGVLKVVLNFVSEQNDRLVD